MSYYVLAGSAADDLESIWEYIAQDSVNAADRLIEKLFGIFDSLAIHPGMGHRREDLTLYPCCSGQRVLT